MVPPVIVGWYNLQKWQAYLMRQSIVRFFAKRGGNTGDFRPLYQEGGFFNSPFGNHKI